MQVGSFVNDAERKTVLTETRYKAFGDEVLCSLPSLAPPCDSFAIWHYLLWAGDVKRDYPSAFVLSVSDLIRVKKLAELNCPTAPNQ